MKKRLSDCIGTHDTISLVGMCKNAGKTTVMNQIIKEMDQQGEILGITSIGRDGEFIDLVTGTDKPGIYVKEGTYLATAAGLLKNCDATREILNTTGIQTPLGEIVVIRAISDGFIDLAGPSMNQQLIEVSEIFRQYKVDKILIDGAISRKSLGSARVAKAVVLATGASYNKNIDVVVEDTKFTCQMLRLKQPVNKNVLNGVKKWHKEKADLEKYLFLNDEGAFKTTETGGTLADYMREKEYGVMSYICVDGALSDAMIKPLLMSNVSLKGKVFLIEDSSKILLSREWYEKLYRKGGTLAVAEEIDLLAVSINPFSAYGNHFDKDEFQEKMQVAVEDLPVLNVIGGNKL